MSNYKPTKFTGVRYREHPTKKHGAIPDKYFLIRYQSAGKRKEEGLGWASAGWSAAKANLTLSELKTAAKTGQGHSRLSAKRKAKAEEQAKQVLEAAAESRRNVTYGEYCKRLYDAGNIKRSSLVRETGLNNQWIIPAIGKVRISDISNIHIRKISHRMAKAGQSKRSIQYGIGVARKVLNHAIRGGYYHKVNPVSALEKKDRPMVDNKRERFFSHDEADQLLTALLMRSKSIHDMTLLSIHSGLRAGEIFKLDWQHIDLKNRRLSLVNTKSGKNRIVGMTTEVRAMFESLPPGTGEQLVFPGRNKQQRTRISKTFDKVVAELGFNIGVTNRLNKAVFHTCRHTCASWLAQSGVPLYQIKEIMGHSTIAITERYAHLCPSGQAAAFAAMEISLNKSREAQRKLA